MFPVPRSKPCLMLVWCKSATTFSEYTTLDAMAPG